MPAITAAKLIVDALLQRFLPLARRRIDTAQAQDGQYLRASDAAYEQVLDSLAMVARHTPVPLLEALLKWRESESPKGANDVSTFQRKLAVECIFCSACIRFVECCPQEGLTETLWIGLENFVFDWLINADRVVSQTEYPSLVDLRGLLLDLVAQLLGALSKIRFTSVTERFFNELNIRQIDTSTARSESLSIIHGMRYLKLGVATFAGLNAATSFVAKANPLSRTPAKKKTELHHAMCNMLSSILAPLAEGNKGQWPPSGVDHALSLWYEAVFRIQSQLMHWMEKQSKHVVVGYPLVTILLCLGDPQDFVSSFGPHLDQLYKLLREKNNRSMALECLHRVLRFYLNVYAESQQQNRVWMTLHSVTAQLLACLKKGFLTQDVQHDKVVDLCVIIAESNLDFAMNHMILELLRTENLSEAKVIGLRALLAIVSSPSHLRKGSELSGTDDLRFSATSSLRSFPSTSWSSSSSAVSASPRHTSAAQGSGFVPDMPLTRHDISPYIPKVRAALGSIIKACHSTYGNALLTSSKATIDALSKEKPQGWLVFRWALKCVPHLIPEQWRNDKMTEIIPVYAISVEPGVREEAVQVLFRTVHDLPQSRFAVMRGMANFILRLPDDFPILIRTSLGRLVQLLQSWRLCLSEEKSPFEVHNNQISYKSGTLKYQNSVPRSSADVSNHFPPYGLDAVGLIFLCSVDIQIRHTALELLRAVRALHGDISKLSVKQNNGKSRQDLEPTFVIDVFEEAGDDIVQQGYFDSGKWYEMRKDWDIIPQDLTLQSVLEGPDKGRWARCLSELVKYCAELCPLAVQGARLEVVERLAHITTIELGGKATASHDSDSRLDQWHMYSMFACSCPPEDADDGGSQSLKDLFRLIMPSLKSGSEGQIYAATVGLGHAHMEICEHMLSELAQFLDDVNSEMENRPKWKSQKLRREDIRVHVANVHRMVADSVWPGMLSRKPVLRVHFIRFIEDTVRHIASAAPEFFQGIQPLRFSLASVLRSVAAEMVKANSERFDLRTRKRLFDLLSSWCDDNTIAWGQQDGVSDYRREVERYKSAQNVRTKDSVEKITIEKEINEQVEAIQWVSMNAMAALLYGPCFDDNVRKMSGRIVSWINGLFVEHAARMPLGYSPADPRTPSHSKFGVAGVLNILRGGRDKQRNSPSRVTLAKTALMNLLQTNLDLFPACIDQCYSSDSSIADGYFPVLAEVYMRHELPKCEVQRLLSLILYKVVDQSRQIRDDALQMLETLSIREWAEDGEGAGRYQAAVVGSLPDSYQQFQYQLSAKLAKEHPELSELLCEEIMQRQLDAVDIIAQHQVLTCMAPWIENLNFVKLWESGWSERLLKSLYYVTWRHGDQFPDEIEKLWSTVATKRRNIIPVLDFLISKGIEDCDSNASGEISGAFATYFSVAKRISLYLARISPQQTIDHLVYELAQRMLEDHPEQLKSSVDGVLETEISNNVLEFSQGPARLQLLEPPPHMSPLLVRSSLEGPLRNVSGSLSWRTATGRSMSGPLNSMSEMHTGRSGQLFTGSGPLMNLSGPLVGAGVRSSTGSVKSRHMSRDSGDYFVDTPNSMEDTRASTPVVTAGDLQSALQSHHHWLSRADIALILLAEIAYENDEDFRGHLPLLFHVTFVSMDSSEDIVLKHCQQLLVNLLYSLAGRHLELYDSGDHGESDYKKQVVSLIKYVQSKKGSTMWENEDLTLTCTELPSAALLSALVLSVVDAIFFQGDLRERWGQEALKWAMECTSRHLASRSHQIYRALRPSVTSDTCVSLLRCLHRCFGNPTQAVLGFIMEILLTLQVMVENMEPEKVILYPQLFWGCVAILHTDFVHVYVQVLELFARVIDRLSFHDQTAEQVLLSNMPRDEFDDSLPDRELSHLDSKEFDTGIKDSNGMVADKAPVFEGVQPLVLKGLMSTVSHTTAIEVLSRITLHSCDRIFGDSDTRLLMHIVGLLPWLGLQLVKGHSPLLPGFDSPLQQQYQKACSVAANIAQWCDAKGLDSLAFVFSAYAEGQVTSIEELLDRVTPLLCAEWFPRHSAMAFGHLLRVLEKGPVEYQRVILLMLRALLKHTPMDLTKSPQVYAAVSQLVESPLCWEALHVLEAVLQSCSNIASFQTDSTIALNQENGNINGNGFSRRLEEDKSAVPFLSQSSFRARSGPLQSWAGSGGTNPVTMNPESVDVLPSRETALQNTRLSLGRVLDTYGMGRKRDYKRLIPFVTNSVQPNNTTSGPQVKQS
ncbi:hypothetical protein O6H91_07G048400 [Diphasiastrum complanatum]|uniref:Uncharacterized protein n=2 Tax=Diphasiastrum complanatum TaxID=34168 RepID=A0ACC2D4W6_DIPCM|nr:hypothetical protein O6H91_07G048400 [Diphasiastrum complanatum]KAJ7549298.1 hypothetical protein O6H91_07G048400 [Diphasiastrum complanatum]